MLAAIFAAGKVIAESWLVETSTQNGEHFTNDDPVGGEGKGITAMLTTDAFHKTGLAQNAQEFGDIVGGNTF